MLKPGVVTALGTMSGTSLDGVDAAIVQTDGYRIHGFGPTAYRAYTADEQALLRAHLGRWQSDDVAGAARLVEDAHIALMGGFDGVEIAGFHGQTLAHDPDQRRTHQCGDGARLAAALDVPVVWDFRSADVAAGGQGAPLAPFYHFALAKWIGATRPIAFLNLGGVGNLTWVDPSFDTPEADGALIAFDTGPANAPVNDLMRARLGMAFDADGALAAQGRADAGILADFMTNPYFDRVPPKSLDRDAFAALVSAVAPLADADAVATLTRAAARAVARAMPHCPEPPAAIYVTGGGRHNATMMAWLADMLNCSVFPVEKAGLDGDMLEAQAFAFLAVRVALGLSSSAPGTTGIGAPTGGGTVSNP